ncbi:alpha/beta hydrolase [Streptomyces radiopugnans]|uniref:Alpha/beta hydrolase fold n=1 Tax=Streptomyces radiopugnans TaxID=403935 RepID=A0A1H9EFR5_9ACTN|nr:alpha/beta hydrolase [Streptomyces radiopugnans]SEQ24103.1 alpha/beta hydrolase fold [Streptomyces radiopugnans]
MSEDAEGAEGLFRGGTVTQGAGRTGERAPSRTPLRTRLRTDDGVGIDACYQPRDGSSAGRDEGAARAAGRGLAIVVAHGFTGSLERPAVRRVSQVFARHADVITFSFRGHGRSGGRSTVGDREVLDLAAAVRWARSLGHSAVVTAGFSMGGSVVLRHAALCRAEPAGTAHGAGPDGGAGPGDSAHRMHRGRTDAHTDAVVAVSAPARWYYRGTPAMRRVHWAIQHPAGRLVSRYGLRTRIHHRDWDPVPLSPVEAAPLIAPTPLLVVHGDRDAYFPLDHPYSLLDAADPAYTELWIERGFGHAENAAPPELLERIASWATARAGRAPRHHGGGTTDG